MKRRISVKMQLLLMSVLPVLVIGVVLLVIASNSLSKGMMSEALEGLQSSCNLYREGLINGGDKVADNAFEDSYKQASGFDYTRFEGDERVATSVVKKDGSRPIGTKAAPEVVTAVIVNGKEYTSEKTDVAGQEYCVAYAPIKDSQGEIVGMAFAGKPRAAMNQSIRRSVTIILIAGVIIMILSAFIAFFLASRLVDALMVARRSVSALSEGSFMKPERHLNRNDELGDMIRDVDELIERLSSIVKNIKASADDVDGSSTALFESAEQIKENCDNVNGAVQDMSRGATDQAETIQKSAENMNELSDAIQSVAENAESLAGTAADMGDASDSSKSSIGQLKEKMEQLSESVDEIGVSIKDTNSAVQNVNKKVDDITAIASQTNLLALNASIEAARAGDAGRGFAVVAEEIGNLAADSARTAEEIRGEMQLLLTQAGNATVKTDEVAGIGRDVEEVLENTVGVVNGLIKDVNLTVDGVNNISALTEECAANKTVIVDGMSSLSAISEENAASAAMTGESMQDLNVTVDTLAENAETLKGVAGKLREELKFFKV